MTDDGAADEADDKGDDPAETVCGQGRSGDDGFSKAQAAQTRQGFQKGEERDQVDRAGSLTLNS